MTSLEELIHILQLLLQDPEPSIDIRVEQSIIELIHNFTLAKTNLQDMHLDGINFENVNLSKSNLCGTDFSYAYLRNADYAAQLETKVFNLYQI